MRSWAWRLRSQTLQIAAHAAQSEKKSACAILSCGCPNKSPHPGWLRTTEVILSQVWRSEVQNQGVGRALYLGKDTSVLFYLLAAPFVP